MPRYLITRDILRASGSQTWLVEAATPEEALRRYTEGHGIFDDEEVSVDELGPPVVSRELEEPQP